MYQNENSCWLELNRTALLHNVSTIKKSLGQKKLAFVVKGNAYGHGLDEIIGICKQSDAIDWFCTATLSEALHLRTLGITKPLLVMSFVDQDPLLALQADIDMAVYDHEHILQLQRVAEQHQKPCYVHIKVDTGLSRFGFSPDEAFALIARLKDHPWLVVRGVMSHFATAEKVDESYARKQMYAFQGLVEQLKIDALLPECVHMQASAASLRYAMPDMTMVRIGAAAYGLWPSQVVREESMKKGIELYPVATWKSRIMHIRSVKSGSTIGYGCTYQATEDMQVAFFPVGYWQGYHRRLSNNACVVIADQHAPVVGVVSMNVTAIDITHLENVHVGSEVVLLGDMQGITAHELADQIGSFNPREVLIRLTAYIPKKVVAIPLAKEDKNGILKGLQRDHALTES